MMDRVRIRGPPDGRLDEALASSIACFFVVVHYSKIRRPSMDIRPLATILTELSATIKTLADQHNPPIPFDQELFMRDHALKSGIDSQAFRAIEILVFAAHASGMTKNSALHQTPAYIEAVKVLRMSGKSLPADL
jgi:hypothetical protein